MKEDPDQIILQVGHRIAELRQGLGISQTDLAHKLGVSPQYIQRVERGDQNLTLRTMAKLAAALEARMLDLVMVPETTRGYRERPGKR